MAGGCEDPDCAFIPDSAEVYDPNTETWSFTGSVNTSARRSHPDDAAKRNRHDVRRPGMGFPFFTDTVEIYNPASGQWSCYRKPPQASLWGNSHAAAQRRGTGRRWFRRRVQQCGVVRPGYGRMEGNCEP